VRCEARGTSRPAASRTATISVARRPAGNAALLAPVGIASVAVVACRGKRIP
jgi:hypothetical protein